MTTAESSQPITARAYLFGDGSETGNALATSLQQTGVLSPVTAAFRGLSRVGRDAVGREVGAIMTGLLNVDFGEVLVGGWRKHAALTAAARRTAANPGSKEIVDLATHRVTSTHRPYLEILLDDVLVATLQVELVIEFVIHALVAIVAHGDLVAFQAGTCDATVLLRFEGQEIIARRAQVKLPLVLRLGEGISLLSAPERLQGPYPQSPRRG
jgi:hypothetical protein